MSDKERVVARLEGKSVYDLRRQYYDIEDTIVDILAGKKNWNNKCDCPIDAVSAFSYLDSDNDEVVKVCMNCGGDLA